ncbi:hypothetical protein HK101_004269 [Irineochytrium annulatum]|nr:hypothetical protein HK101_004269 [Irineochytrium annulatum]
MHFQLITILAVLTAVSASPARQRSQRLRPYTGGGSITPKTPVTPKTPPPAQKDPAPKDPAPKTPTPKDPTPKTPTPNNTASCDQSTLASIQATADDFVAHLNQVDGCGNGWEHNDPGFSENLAAMWLRAIFHDAGTFVADGAQFGLDGSVANEIEDAHAGLAKSLPLQVFDGEYHSPFSTLPEPSSSGVQLGDLIAIAGVTAVQHCGGPTIPVSVGLHTVEPGVPNDVNLIPSNPFMDTEDLYAAFDRMGISDKAEVFALTTGSHTLGGVHAAIVGSDLASGNFEPFDRTPTVFDNDVFVKLLEDPKDCVLPIDCKLAADPDNAEALRIWVEDEQTFFDIYAVAMHKLLTMNSASFGAANAVACPFSTPKHDFRMDTAAGNGTDV